MKRYLNRKIYGAIHNVLVRLFGEKGASYAWIGLLVLIFIIGLIIRVIH